MVIFSTKHLLSPEVLPSRAEASSQGQQKATRHLPAGVGGLSWHARADATLTQGVLVLSPRSSDQLTLPENFRGCCGHPTHTK